MRIYAMQIIQANRLGYQKKVWKVIIIKHVILI